MVLKMYVAGVAALAATVAAVAAITVPVDNPPAQLTIVFMGGLLWLTEFLQVRQYHYRGHGASLNLFEGVLAPIVYACSGLQTVLICFLSLAAAEVFRRTGIIKTVFNVSQWVLAAGCGALMMHALAPDRSDDGWAALAVVCAVLTMSLVNHIAMALVLSLAVRAANDRQSRAQAIAGVVNRLISNGAALVTGLTLVAVYRWQPALLVIGVVGVVALDAAGRAHASSRADSHRLEGLQRATHALATSIDLDEALPVFLEEARIGFEVRKIDLVHFSDTHTVVHRCLAPEDGGYRVVETAHEFADLLRPVIVEATHVSVESDRPELRDALAAEGHSRALAVPLRRGSLTVGMLLLYDRLGVEGFEAGERRVAAALGRELVSFLERVDLVSAIDEERRKLTDIVESTSDGILTIDSHGVVTSWNSGLVAMTGYASAEMIGTRHLGLLRARDGGGRDILIERWRENGEPPPAELQIVTQTGATLWLSCSYSQIPAAEGDNDVLVVVARNITQARELEKLKDDFVAVVSHELRTPLVPIKGWAQTLLNRGDRLNDDQRRTAVQSILAQSQKLESLVLNILEASRIESGRIDGDGVADVAAITLRIVEDTLAARPDREVRVQPPAVPCTVRGSAVWVERAVANLVANAIKYSPDDEPVDVGVRVEGDEVLVSVTDRGPGIASDSHERIFERFERLEETRKQTGTGLGLYITRRLARAMGGDVSVSSVPGAGSTFLLRLPAAPVPMRLPEQRPTEAASDQVPAGDSNVVNLR